MFRIYHTSEGYRGALILAHSHGLPIAPQYLPERSGHAHLVPQFMQFPERKRAVDTTVTRSYLSFKLSLDSGYKRNFLVTSDHCTVHCRTAVANTFENMNLNWLLCEGRKCLCAILKPFKGLIHLIHSRRYLMSDQKPSKRLIHSINYRKLEAQCMNIMHWYSP